MDKEDFTPIERRRAVRDDDDAPFDMRAVILAMKAEHAREREEAERKRMEDNAAAQKRLYETQAMSKLITYEEAVAHGVGDAYPRKLSNWLCCGHRFSFVDQEPSANHRQLADGQCCADCGVSAKELLNSNQLFVQCRARMEADKAAALTPGATYAAKKAAFGRRPPF